MLSFLLFQRGSVTLTSTPVLDTTLDGLTLHRRGKVRDVYEVPLESGETALLMIATDRISAFDYVLGSGIPDKGKVLTQLSAFWFGRTQHRRHAHLPERPAGRQPHPAGGAVSHDGPVSRASPAAGRGPGRRRR